MFYGFPTSYQVIVEQQNFFPPPVPVILDVLADPLSSSNQAKFFVGP